ncbi:piggyBac transposable element-derived protein 3-like [Nilaparvata lugens]|uniref:piggyBac transposable element-derived protein 3-like n=1 Tax=Nilaparvata lugens TaxID=108931 RepID=UPI00193DAA0E|nr:piggyBac transposable element-derived protein 3-like [Nilaparvata lugens]
MSAPFLSPEQIGDMLRGDLSDIEDLNEEDDDADDELQVNEEELQRRLQVFEEGLNQVEYDTNIQNDDPAPDLPEVIGLDNNEGLIEVGGETASSYNPVPRWRKPRDFRFPEKLCEVQITPPEEMKTPKQYFDMFIDSEIIENLVVQTNLYSVQKSGASINTNRAEIEQFLGINLLSSIVRMPSYRMYWANETRYSPIADKISRNRYDKLRTYFHVNDNTHMLPLNDANHDKLFKIRPFVNAVRENMKKVEPEEKCSVDEMIIPFKGRSKMKQYIKNKPHKWGIKVFAIASQSGIVHDFEVYVGKGTVKSTNNKLGLSGEIVVRLSEVIPKFQNYKLFCDNWFTSYHLICELKVRGILAVGTVRSNRLCGCQLENDKILPGKGRGSYDEMIDIENEVFVCKWYDNRCVSLVSSFAAAEPVKDVQRYSVAEKQRIPVPWPNIVKEYNSAMGGVDLHDMLVELYT